MAPGKRGRIVLIWHMHQPTYRSPISQEYLVPWVLLHAMRDYYDMPLLAAKHEGMRVTFNVVPGLFRQIEEYADLSARDIFLHVAMKPPAQLTRQERLFLLEHFFNVHPDTMVKPHQRYAELAEKASMLPDREAVVDWFDDQDILDLQVWYFLAWAGLSLQQDERVAALIERGRGFTQKDKELFRSVVLEQLGDTVPLYRRLAREARIEVSASPMYHPILPLLVSTESAREAWPLVKLPAGHFAHAEDARLQVKTGMTWLQKAMGVPIAGLWPSEGGVSTEVLRMAGEEGVRWVATDEKLLLATLSGRATAREDLLYRPWKVGETAVFFRDARLSDLIGFTYSRWNIQEAVGHFIRECARSLEACSLPDPVITIAMDGENAWEYYVNGGMRFLDELYAALVADERFDVVTPSDVLAVAEDLPALERVRAGSWIDGTFATWIGDPVKNRGWEQLTSARDALQTFLARNQIEPRLKEELVDLMMRAEASDWFWWLGQGHTSRYDPEFDLLFRHHLKAIYLRIGMHPPEELDWPLDPPNRDFSVQELPVHLVSPEITGKKDSYYKWLSAGRVEVKQGFFHRPRINVRELRFGFDKAQVYFMVDCLEPLLEMMKEQRMAFVVHFRRPVHRDLRLTVDPKGRPRVYCMEKREYCSDVALAVDSVLELGIPFSHFHDSDTPVGPGTVVEAYLIVSRRGREIERFPQTDNIVFTIRGEDLDAENWHV